MKKKGTIKTFSVENSDSDDAFILKCTDKLKDGTETIENSDIYSFYCDEGTRLTKSIEDSDSDESIFIANNKKTLLKDSVEQSDPDNALWF